MKKKRSKRSRLRGRGSCGYGARKKHRGKGSRGGKGMAGTGKRAGHKITYVLKYHPNYLGKHGFKSLKKLKLKKGKERAINLAEIEEKLDSFLKKGIAKESKEGIHIELPKYKILSKGIIKRPFIIKAASFSKKAAQKIEKLGGKIIKA